MVPRGDGALRSQAILGVNDVWLRRNVINADLLPPTVLTPREVEIPSRIPPEGVKLEEMMADYERALLREALEQTGGVKKRAAARLGVSFRSFRYRLEKLGMGEDEGPGA